MVFNLNNDHVSLSPENSCPNLAQIPQNREEKQVAKVKISGAESVVKCLKFLSKFLFLPTLLSS